MSTALSSAVDVRDPDWPERVVRGAAATTISIGALVFVGWSFDLAVFKSVVPGLASMKANTAIAFVLVGAALWLAPLNKVPSRRGALVCTGGGILVGVVNLVEAAFDWNLGINELIFRDHTVVDPSARPGRLSATTAACLVAAGIALLSSLGGLAWLAHLLALAVALVCGLAVVGYLYEAEDLYQLAHSSPMPLHTAFTFLIVSAGILHLRPSAGVMKVLTSQSAAAVVARRLVPAAIAIPVVIGWVRLKGEQAGLYGTEFGVALMAVSNVIWISALIWWSTRLGITVDQERVREREALKVNEERLRLAVAGASLGTWHWDFRSGELVWSDAALAMLGLPPGEAMSHERFLAALHQEDRQMADRALAQALADESEYDIEVRAVWPDGTQHWIAASGRAYYDGDEQPLRMEGLARDITESKRLEEQLHQSQKMEAVGRLAGGIAHDFNNLLGIIIGYGGMLMRQLEPAHKGRAKLEQILNASERAAGLTHQLLAFSRKQVLEPRVLDLGTLVAETGKMLARLIGEDVQLETVKSEKLWLVKADPGQMEQILMNLAINARDAMPDGGRLTIETANAELDAAYASAHSGVEAGEYVVLAMSDTGCGMDQKTLAKIFEPFFTTKEAGKGTGLGLATVYGIVKQSDGHISVYSEPGKGTTFRIYLPRVHETAATRKVAAEEAPLPRGSETILLVEDVDALREMAREVLEDLGYVVIDARSGAHALERAAAHDGPLNLLITDVVMPGMGGRDLWERLVAVRPECKVMFMSGYTDDAIIRHGVLEPGTAFLSKPFVPGTLARKVREVLDPRPQREA